MPASPIARPERFTRCFGCGPDNPRGLALEFRRDGDCVEATFVPPLELGGYGQLLHGGVTATLIDEAFGWALYGLLGVIGVTLEMQVTFSAPLQCGVPLVVRGRVLERDERTVTVRADVLGPGDRTAATGTGRLRLISQRAVERLGGFKAG